MAPGLKGNGTYVYEVAHNLIRAHAKAYRLYYNEGFAQGQLGQVGITLNVNWAEPEDTSNQPDLAAAQTKLQFDFGWFAKPILVDGFYPPVMRSKIDEKSAQQVGYMKDRTGQK